MKPNNNNNNKIVSSFNDHNAVIIEILYSIVIKSKPKKQVYCCNRADWDALHEEMTDQNENNNRSVEEN